MRTQNCVCVRVHCVYLFALRIFVSTCVSVDDSVYVCVYVCVYAYVHACVYANSKEQSELHKTERRRAGRTSAAG